MSSAAEDARVFASVLRATAANIGPEVEKSIFKGSMNIKKQLVQEMGRSKHFGQIARSITFDIKQNADRIVSEIGPESGRGNPGALANIAYFGTSRGGGTVRDPVGALDAELPALEKYLADIVVKGLE